MIKMTTQNYCMVNGQTGVCENVTVWDGNTETWQPPDNYIMLPQETTPAKTWAWNSETNAWALSVEGMGQIGFTWDGVYLITNEPEPTNVAAPNQPTVTGVQTL